MDNINFDNAKNTYTLVNIMQKYLFIFLLFVSSMLILYTVGYIISLYFDLMPLFREQLYMHSGTSLFVEMKLLCTAVINIDVFELKHVHIGAIPCVFGIQINHIKSGIIFVIIIFFNIIAIY